MLYAQLINLPTRAALSCLQIVRIAAGKARPRPEHALAHDEEMWRRDPLSHPDLRRMSERELADLPFDPSRFTWL